MFLSFSVPPSIPDSRNTLRCFQIAGEESGAESGGEMRMKTDPDGSKSEHKKHKKKKKKNKHKDDREKRKLSTSSSNYDSPLMFDTSLV